MILHSNDGSFGIQRSVRIAEVQEVGKFQRCCTGEQNLAWSSKFDDCAFLHSTATRLVCFAVAFARELNGNSDRSSIRKKTGQVCDLAGLRRARWCCGLLRQAVPLPYLPQTCTGFPGDVISRAGFACCSAVGLPLFPVRKSIGEPESAVMASNDARPLPQCRTEGLALRRSFFQQLRISPSSDPQPTHKNASQSETSSLMIISRI